MTTDIAVAAAEPATERKSTQAIWLEMQAAVRAWARQHADQVVADHGNIRIHVDGSGDHDHDSGLVPLYTTIDGVRKIVAMPEQGIEDFPSPYMRFHLGSYGKTVIFHICVDADKMTKEKTVNVASQGADTDPRLIVPLILSVIKKVIVPDLHQVHADTEVTAAAVSCLDVVAVTLGDGSKLHGRTVFGFEVETAEVLSLPDAVALRLAGGDNTAFVRVNPDKSVTAQVFHGVRVRTFTTKLKSTRLAAIVKSLSFDEDTDQVATAAAEPHVELHGQDLADAWYDVFQRITHNKRDAVIAECGKFKVHIKGPCTTHGTSYNFPLYTTYDGHRVYTLWQGSDFALPQFSVMLKKEQNGPGRLVTETNVGAFFQDMPERVRRTEMPAPQADQIMPALIKILRNDVQRLYAHVDTNKLTLMPSSVHAAAEPPSGSNVFKVLAQLLHLRIQSKHFRIRFQTNQKPHVDDHGTVYILGDVLMDEAAEAMYGEHNFRYGFTVWVRGDADYTVSDTNPYEIKLPQAYPDPQAPVSVPLRRELAPNGASLADVARAVTKALLPWFKDLDAKVDDDLAVGAALLLPGDKVHGEYFTATPRDKLELNTSTHQRTRRYIIELKQPVLYKVFDNELKPMPGDQNRYVFFACVLPGAAEGKVQVGFSAGPATHDGNRQPAGTPSPLRFDHSATAVAVENVKRHVHSALLDYIYKLDDALRAVNS